MSATYFSKIIKAGQRQREFNFRRLSATGPETRYHVDVNDDKGNRLIFNLVKGAEGQWKTAGTGLPEWVYGAEEALGSSIEEHLSA